MPRRNPPLQHSSRANALDEHEQADGAEVVQRLSNRGLGAVYCWLSPNAPTWSLWPPSSDQAPSLCTSARSSRWREDHSNTVELAIAEVSGLSWSDTPAWASPRYPPPGVLVHGAP